MHIKLSTAAFCLLCLLAFNLTASQPTFSKAEKSFETLTIGTQTYSNVTVTTQTKDYVFLLHSRGMVNVKVSELPAETRELLGYEIKKPAGTTATTWAKKTISNQKIVNLNQPEVKELQKELEKKISANAAQFKGLTPKAEMGIVGGMIAAFALLYVFFCYCSKLICTKAGYEPGVLIWLPLLQMIPMVKAAKMSGLWVVAFFVPVLNLIAQIIWCIRISKARGKSLLTAIFLLLPFTNLFAFLYLAFSDGAAAEPEKEKRVEIMTLEAT